MIAPRILSLLKGSRNPKLVKVNWNDLPARLQSVYGKRDPLYRLEEDIDVVWRIWRIRAERGLYTDLSSIPMFLSIFGVSRFQPDGRFDLGGLLHDPVYRGAARFCDNHRENRRLADWMMKEVWQYCGAGPRQSRRYWKRVRRWGWWPYNPKPELHSVGFFSIERVDLLADSELRHKLANT